MVNLNLGEDSVMAGRERRWGRRERKGVLLSCHEGI